MGKQLRFVDLFSGLGGFHLGLKALGHKCVFACDIDKDLRAIYKLNFSIEPQGDLRSIKAAVIPPHDILCAGFPCQPFSKAGEQLGTRCKLWGDLFSKHVLRVIRHHRPTYLLMENVANLERHDGGRTWRTMKAQLQDCGYDVHSKILSPHQYGIPQKRERLFVVGYRMGLGNYSWPEPPSVEPSIHSVLSVKPKGAKELPEQVLECLDAWQDFLRRAPKHIDLPSFPIWTMEFGATYPYTKYDSLHTVPLSTLRHHRGNFGQSLNRYFRKDILERVPSHARADANAFPRWKQLFIRQNRHFYSENRDWIKPWLEKIQTFPPSLQKFEWNCKGEVRDLWRHVIQFRASGVRVKRPTTAPSIVAMTTTQVPIIGWEKRYMTPQECCRLQSMETLAYLPRSETQTYKALGNAVNAEVVRLVAEKLLAVGGAKISRNVA